MRFTAAQRERAYEFSESEFAASGHGLAVRGAKRRRLVEIVLESIEAPQFDAPVAFLRHAADARRRGLVPPTTPGEWPTRQRLEADIYQAAAAKVRAERGTFGFVVMTIILIAVLSWLIKRFLDWLFPAGEQP